jgi:hypothetical protein
LFTLHINRCADLLFKIAPHRLGLAIGTGDPGGSARIDAAVRITVIS